MPAAQILQYRGLEYAASLYQHWTFALFYVVAELYSSVSISVLFWQFANAVVPVSKSVRFYPLFGQVSSLAPILAGQYVRLYAAAEGTDMTGSMHRVTGAVCACGVAMMALHHHYMNLVESETAPISPASTPAKKKAKKPKMSLGESLKFLARSEYLGAARGSRRRLYRSP